MTNLRGPPNTTLLPEGQSEQAVADPGVDLSFGHAKTSVFAVLTLRYGAYGKLWQRG
ncbi:hypothetical protein [Streptomyces sp. NPDC047981]|uniref:hypothetical protein n=1 Tax=Streptomyces sp. NPDC047981 TaxID=3154610 RepID=UPI0034343C38